MPQLSFQTTFAMSIEQPLTAIDVILDSRVQANILRNWSLLKSITQTALFCGRQCIGLRGDAEGRACQGGNPGNFIALLRLIARHDSLLQEHLQQPSLRNCTYTSPQIQNELIEIIGYDIIQEQIVEEVKQAVYYSVRADEVTSHNVLELAAGCSWLLAICL